jgi:quercetin dioxygenase-like cupin family protein
MGAPTVIPPGGGEVIGDAPERRVEILSDHPAVHATSSRFGPRHMGADLHVHRRHTDLFYVLAGELTVMLGTAGEEVVVPAGRVARVPPLVVHGFRNAGDGELRYLNFHAPGVGFANYLRGLRDGRIVEYDQEAPPADGGRPTSEAAIGEPAGDGRSVHVEIEALTIAETRGDHDAVARHAHDRHVEAYYVLDGELALTVGNREVHAAAGTWVQVPPGIPHGWSCVRPARLLTVRAPRGTA